MPTLTPFESSNLASRVYLVQDELTVGALLNDPLFSIDAERKTSMNANVGGRFIRAAKDAFAVCAKGSGRFKEDVFLIFRGSTNANNSADWISNARIGLEFSQTGLPVHIGFNQIFRSLLGDIRQFLHQNVTSKTTIHILGHSLGGAVANLAADWVKKNYGRKVILYSYGAPRVGGFWFARKAGIRLKEQNIYRVYHKTDPVPMIPVFPYTHTPVSDTGYQLHSSQSIVSTEAHDIKGYRNAVKESTWASLQGPLAPFQIDHVIEQWLRSDHQPNAADPTIWDWLNAATIWVLRKVLLGGLVVAQATFIGLHSLADKIAWALKTGADTSKDVSFWVVRLLKKIMRVLGMPVIETTKELTQAFMRKVLIRLIERITYHAQQAIRQITGPR
ncbi:lipase (class 3) [Marinimicrobium koreense]|uniref:Lipase (Class 3) n=1 Tax=Marinimicrobium koreense TaxID=306545 RepID=A0A3N1NQF4_9GAMM|nr:lipase family protein [Marinimicrobium koreense]ROQ18425.1 lipase (class 3) [Marinimicrobium koreense]